MIRKQSKQRDIVLQYMKNIKGHVCAETIYEDLSKQGKKISLATVYRNLNVLVEMKEIKKLAHPTLGYVYDKTCKPHHHFYCSCCQTIYDLEIPYDETLHKKFEVGTNFEITSHSIMFEGICDNCKSNLS